MELKLDTQIVDNLKSHLNGLYREALDQARRDAGISKEYLTIPEALKYAGVSRNTLNNNFIANGLPIYQVEGKTYVKKSEINDFIAKHKI